MKNNIFYAISVVFLVISALIIFDGVKAGTIYFPIVANNAQAVSANPRGSLFVFTTSQTTNGNPGGRPGMNIICSNQDLESHFCSLYEIREAIFTKGVYFNAPFQEAWVDYLLVSNDRIYFSSDGDCHGWTDTTNPNQQGQVFLAQAIGEGGVKCDSIRPVTCCKWIP